jgi:hypothetical protein
MEELENPIYQKGPLLFGGLQFYNGLCLVVAIEEVSMKP